MNILIVEDEIKIQQVLEAYLRREGWEVVSTGDGNDAINKFMHFKFDMVILDRMIIGMQGEEVCREIRKMSYVPIIMITSKSRESDVIDGYNLGADVYVSKPFRIKEVIAQIHAIRRRVAVQHDSDNVNQWLTFNNGSLKINLIKKEVYVGGRPVSLTTTQLNVLSTLIKHPGKVFNRNDLSYEVQGYRYIGDGRTMDAHIKNIRKKIEDDPRNPKYIVTMIGSGYKFAYEPDRGTDAG
ncbi:response regulator transcription factor [Paenibacillus tarimensis]